MQKKNKVEWRTIDGILDSVSHDIKHQIHDDEGGKLANAERLRRIVS